MGSCRRRYPEIIIIMDQINSRQRLLLLIYISFVYIDILIIILNEKISEVACCLSIIKMPLSLH